MVPLFSVKEPAHAADTVDCERQRGQDNGKPTSEWQATSAGGSVWDDV